MKPIQIFVTMLIGVWLPELAYAQPEGFTHALYLNGKGAHVQLPDNMLVPLAEATVETWVKWEKLNRWSRVFDFGREGNAAVLQNERISSTLGFAIYDRAGKRHRVRETKAVTLDTWYHIAVVCGSGGMELYINGELAKKNGYEGGLNEVAGGYSYIGRSNWPQDDFFTGYISDFRIWGKRRMRSSSSTAP